MNAQRFWVIWCPSHGSPTYRHANKCDAVHEARRLASAHPGYEFILCEAIAAYQKTDVLVTELQPVHQDSEIPF